jgi:methionyl-tRNA synthetase
MRDIMALADKANQYIDEKQPWVAIKDESRHHQVQDVCSIGLNCFRQLVILLKPVLPKLAAQAEAFLNVEDLKWDDLGDNLLDHAINRFKPLMTRIEPAFIERMIEATKADLASEQKIQQGSSADPSIEAIAPEINYRQNRRRPARREIRQAAAVDARHRQRNAQCLRRHRRRLQPGGPRRQAHRYGRQPGAA